MVVLFGNVDVIAAILLMFQQILYTLAGFSLADVLGLKEKKESMKFYLNMVSIIRLSIGFLI